MNIDLPPEIGVMVLPSVTLFPGGIVPLRIFEPRYRQMLEAALEGRRMFGLAHVSDSGIVRDIGGIGIVRACVKNPDGTSNLMLQGTSRVRFTSWREEPYPIAAIEPVSEEEPVNGDAGPLRQRILRQCEIMRISGHELPPQFDDYINGISSHGAFCDIIASIVITRPDARQMLLEEFDISDRMELLLTCLREEKNGI